MSANIILALVITAIGMGLVFLAILLLWAGMAILVKFTSDKDIAPGSSPFDQDDGLENSESSIIEKQKAAAIAVAFALGNHSKSRVNVLPLPATTIVSAWQAVTRSNNLSSRRRSR